MLVILKRNLLQTPSRKEKISNPNRGQIGILLLRIHASHSITAPAIRSQSPHFPKTSLPPTRAKFAAASVLSLVSFTENTIIIDFSIPHRRMYACIMSVAIPHVGMRHHSTAFESQFNWHKLGHSYSAVRFVWYESLPILSFFYSLLSLIPTSILHPLHLRVFSGLLFLYILLLAISSSPCPGGPYLNLFACISLVYIAFHLSITLHMKQIPHHPLSIPRAFQFPPSPLYSSKSLIGLFNDPKIKPMYTLCTLTSIQKSNYHILQSTKFSKIHTHNPCLFKKDGPEFTMITFFFRLKLLAGHVNCCSNQSTR